MAGERDLNKGVAWYENNGCSGGPPCGASTTFTEHVITNTLTETVATYAVDFDVDGDVDLMAASSSDGKIALYLNDGSHDFSPTTPTDDPDTTEIILSEWATGATALDVADFNGDGHLDVVFAGEQLGGCQFGVGRQCTLPDDSPRNCGMGNGNCDDMVVYYLNRGTRPPTFYENQIKTLSPLGAGPEYFVQAIDVDDDGDVDVMLGSTQLEQPRWYENDCAGAPTPKPTGGFPSLVPLPVPTSVPSTVPTLAMPTTLPTHGGCSELTCDELGWTNAASAGISSAVCGETDGSPLSGCSGLLTWAEAATFCRSAGARLCTEAEASAGEAQGTGCRS